MTRPIRRLVAGAAFFLATFVVGFTGYRSAGWSAMDALYMVVITVFGVGYGEVQPVATGETGAPGCAELGGRVPAPVVGASVHPERPPPLPLPGETGASPRP